MKKNNNKILVISLIIILILVGTIGILKFNDINKKYKNNKTLYCKIESKEEEKIEFYFNFLDGKVYQYTIITTNPITESFDKEKYQKAISINNDKYEGFTSKIFSDDKKYIITEVYNLNNLSDEDTKSLTIFHKKELRNLTREEIKENIIVFSDDATYTCN